MFTAINAIDRAQRAVHHAHRIAAARHDQWGDQVKAECDGASDDLEDAKECLEDPTELLISLENLSGKRGEGAASSSESSKLIPEPIGRQDS